MSRHDSHSPEQIRARLKGPVASIPTPFTANGDIHWEGVAAVIETALGGGCGVILLTIGDSQYFYMTPDEIAAITKFAIECTAGRALLVAATGPWATRQSVAFAEYSRDQGADVLMSLPPAQMTSGPGLVAHYKALAAVMPVMLVGCPSHQVLEQLVDQPAICCFKEDGSEAYAVELLQKYGHRWSVMTGGTLQRHLLEWPFGAQSFMDWSTSFAPQIGASFWKAIERENRIEAARITTEIERPIFDLAAALDPAFGWQMLWHACLSIKGIAQHHLRLPHPTATDEQVERVRAKLDELGIR